MISISRIQLRRKHFDRPRCQRHWSGRVCLVFEHNSSCFKPPWRGYVYRLTPEVLLFRGTTGRVWAKRPCATLVRLVRRRKNTADFSQQNQVDESHFDRPWCQRYRLVGCVSSLDFLESQGDVPTAFTLFGGVMFIARRLRHYFLEKYRQGLRHYLSHRVRLDYVPALRLLLKKLCATLIQMVGRKTNTADFNHLNQDPL